MYGFHKTRGIGKEGEGFEHEKFNRKSTKEQIKQMMRQNKKMKLLSKYVKTNTNTNTNTNEDYSNDEFSYNNENDIFQFLLEKNEENTKNILELKNEMAELKTNNLNLYNQLQKVKEGQSIIFSKIIKNQNNIKNHDKSQNLKELFRRYLYFLKIYSPLFMLKNFDSKKIYQTEKVDSFTFGNIGIFKKETTNINNFNNIHNINNINVNMDSFFDEPSFIKQRQDFKSFDFIIHNNNTSNENSFFNNNREFK